MSISASTEFRGARFSGPPSAWTPANTAFTLVYWYETVDNADKYLFEKSVAADALTGSTITLSDAQKDKVEFLCNECCHFDCRDRKACYETVSRKNLGENCPDHRCSAPDASQGYRFSKAMENPGFIGIEDIRKTYLPMGFSHFKIEGRGLGSALILELLLYYMTKPEYQIHVREAVYLDSMLDLF